MISKEQKKRMQELEGWLKQQEGGRAPYGKARNSEGVFSPGEIETGIVLRPDLFKAIDIGGRPGVELRSGLSPELIELLTVASEYPAGLTRTRAKRNHGIENATIEEGLKLLPDVLTTVKVKTFGKETLRIILKHYVRPADFATPVDEISANNLQPAEKAFAGDSRCFETPEDLQALAATNVRIDNPSQVEGHVLARASQFVLHLMPGWPLWRDNRWCEAQGYSMEEILGFSRTYPGVFLITEETSTVGHFEWRISLAPQPVKPAPEDSAVVPARPEPPAPVVIPDAEYERMRRRPGSRGMWRGARPHEQSVRHRVRRPLVDL